MYLPHPPTPPKKVSSTIVLVCVCVCVRVRERERDATNYSNELTQPMCCFPQVEIRPMMYVALTYDHRLVDGREAVTFLRKIKSAVEDPRVILLDL